MAIIDLPTTRAFQGAAFSIWVNTSERAFTGFFTGNRTTRSNSADRLGCMVTLPLVKHRIDAAAREAWNMGLRSTGDHVRFGVPHRPLPLGTLRGTVTVSANALAGARSVSLAGVLARPNLLLNHSFETDTNVDGLANGWTQYSTGTTGTITPSRVAGNGSTFAQRLEAAGLGSASSDQVGVYYAPDAGVTAGLSYALSADTRDNGPAIRMHIDWYDGGASIISSSTAVAASSGSVWARRSVVGTAPTGAVVARLYVWMEAMPGGPAAAAIEIDNVQFEQASAATAYAGLATAAPGDFIGIGGNLLQAAYPGSTANDAGAMTFTTTTPLQKAISSAAAVTWSAPTGVWELDDQALQLDYTPGIIQGPIVLRFRQVPQ